MDFFSQLITWINVPVNAAGEFLLAPVAVLPEWLSNTIISAVAGVILITIFKYTSNQTAIGKVRDRIKANMLALKLFKDSMSVTLKAQGRLFTAAGLLLVYALVPMLVMIVPVSLLLGQMGLWYQYKPLQPGQETIVAMQLNGPANTPLPQVNIKPTDVVDITTGPVHVTSKQQVYWKIKANQEGLHHLIFQIEGEDVEKELAVGEELMRISSHRPGWQWPDILLYPHEKPFVPDSPVKSISIEYPPRGTKTFGINNWLIYFFIASMIFAFIFKPILKVKI